MKLSAIFIGIGIALIVFLVLVPFFIGSRVDSDREGGAGIFKSTDGGLTWSLAVRSSEIAASLPRNIASFAFHPNDANTIYLGTKGGGLWVSKNAGANWSRLDDAKGDLKPTAEIYDVSIASGNPDLIYVAAYQDDFGRVFRSSDGGISFDQVYIVPVRRYGVFGVKADPASPNRVFIATGQGGFLVSDDKGESWEVRKWFPGGLLRIMQNPGDSSEIYILASGGDLYRTNDRGESWVRLTEGYRAFRDAEEIHDVALDPANPAVLYTGSRFGVLRSENSGRVWRAVPLIIPPTALPTRAIAINPNNSSNIFVAANSAVYRSDDYGEHWQILALPTREPIKMLRVSPDADVIYAIAGR